MKSTFLSTTAALLLGSCILVTTNANNNNNNPTNPINSINPANATEQCVLSLIGLLSDQGLSSCMPLQQMTQLISASPTPQVVNETTEAMCSRQACSPQTVSLVENTINQNCIPGSDPQKTMVVSNIFSLYAPAREGLCQKSANGTYCTTLFAQNMTNYVNEHPLPTVGANMTAGDRLKWGNYLNNIPSDLLCTDCNKAILTPMNNYITQNQTSFSPLFLGWVNDARTQVTNKCGQDFLGNGTAPNPSAIQDKEGTSAGFVSTQASLALGLICTFIAVGAQFF